MPKYGDRSSIKVPLIDCL
jgi:lipid-binding SYLF domain-containing protein